MVRINAIETTIQNGEIYYDHYVRRTISGRRITANQDGVEKRAKEYEGEASTSPKKRREHEGGDEHVQMNDDQR